MKETKNMDVFDWLLRMEHQPGLFLGRNSLERLSMFLCGFEVAIHSNKIPAKRNFDNKAFCWTMQRVESSPRLTRRGIFCRNSQFCGRKSSARSFHCQKTESKGDAE